MKVTINGKTKTFTTPLSISEALAQEGYKDMTVAVARNGDFVPRGKYGETTLRDGDDIEILAPMQGG